MERLTERLENGVINVKYASQHETAIHRLVTIEDILGDEYDLDRLRELAEADKEGRCVVQPRSDDTQTAMPAGAAPIVYCKDCAYLRYSDFYGECSRGLLGIVGPLDYCRRGRVKEGAG